MKRALKIIAIVLVLVIVLFLGMFGGGLWRDCIQAMGHGPGYYSFYVQKTATYEQFPTWGQAFPACVAGLF